MILKKGDIQFLINRIPLIGILCFVAIYFYSATLYPGGSQADPNSIGFDWINNYWCNLMNDQGMNGQPNPGRPFAIIAMIILCLSLMNFFIRFANVYTKSSIWKQIVKIGGVLSMGFAILISTEYHDLMTILSSLFGLFAVAGIMREIYKSDLRAYKWIGILCVLLLAINNYIYYSEHYLEALPLLQKITFAIVLLWIVGLNFELIKTKKNSPI